MGDKGLFNFLEKSNSCNKKLFVSNEQEKDVNAETDGIFWILPDFHCIPPIKAICIRLIIELPADKLMDSFNRVFLGEDGEEYVEDAHLTACRTKKEANEIFKLYNEQAKQAEEEENQ